MTDKGDEICGIMHGKVGVNMVEREIDGCRNVVIVNGGRVEMLMQR